MRRITIPGVTEEEYKHIDELVKELTLAYSKVLLKRGLSERESVYGLASFTSSILSGLYDPVDDKDVADIYCEAVKYLKKASDECYEEDLKDNRFVQLLSKLGSLKFEGLFPRRRKKNKDAS